MDSLFFRALKLDKLSLNEQHLPLRCIIVSQQKQNKRIETVSPGETGINLSK